MLNNNIARHKIEKYLHPLIWKELVEETKNSAICFVEVPLLFEAKWEKYFDTVLLIVSPSRMRTLRLKEKGMTAKEIKQWFSLMLPTNEKIKKSDKVIYNEGDIENLYNQLERWWQEYDW